MLKITVTPAQASKEATKTYEVLTDQEGLKLNGEEFSWDLLQLQDNSYHIIHNNKTFQVEILKADYLAKTFTLQVNGHLYTVNSEDKMDLLLKRLGMDNVNQNKVNDVKAPMPGLILSVNVNEGDEVKKGDILMILEAMKMENALKCPADGKVKAVKVKQGQNVEKNQLLILFE
ncbi:acetyl-CoA carboxylase biotin carboxyl carrier protein subunit [Microscilla marina]|uniref:Biotin carboxyl carrier protein n=1 Tax=Microscilla marina ATCC 23134 TaxID=313606 RepID=A1ZLS6_MICM2|nr:acetyl-CoA carboxylase biotin carboxyl carrier protein subunit [Microscilla marina]EAY28830.1 biotin carboxyl carrier protein [Microscilla marina ATCC 23134]